MTHRSPRRRSSDRSAARPVTVALALTALLLATATGLWWVDRTAGTALHGPAAVTVAAPAPNLGAAAQALPPRLAAWAHWLRAEQQLLARLLPPD